MHGESQATNVAGDRGWPSRCNRLITRPLDAVACRDQLAAGSMAAIIGQIQREGDVVRLAL